MAPKEKKTKAQIAAAAASGGKGKKKKWSKGKQKDKLNNAVFLEKAVHTKIMTEIPKSKYITPSIVSERYHLNVSMARQVIRHLLERGEVRTVGDVHSKQIICTRNVVPDVEEPKGKSKKGEQPVEAE